MKRTTITLPDDLGEAIERFQAEQDVRLPLSALAQAAIREYLARRGYASSSGTAEFAITPAIKGSGSGEISAEHDRALAESLARE